MVENSTGLQKQRQGERGRRKEDDKAITGTKKLTLKQDE
jgi:hypothetical protein